MCVCDCFVLWVLETSMRITIISFVSYVMNTNALWLTHSLTRVTQNASKLLSSSVFSEFKLLEANLYTVSFQFFKKTETPVTKRVQIDDLSALV